MNGMDKSLCKTDLILIRRHTFMCNTFSDVDFEAFCKSAYVPLWYSQFQQKRVSKGGGCFLCNDLDLIWLLSELNTPHQLSLVFWERIPRQPYVMPLAHYYDVDREHITLIQHEHVASKKNNPSRAHPSSIRYSNEAFMLWRA